MNGNGMPVDASVGSIAGVVGLLDFALLDGFGLLAFVAFALLDFALLEAFALVGFLGLSDFVFDLLARAMPHHRAPLRDRDRLARHVCCS
jgi:hypothetical protein